MNTSGADTMTVDDIAYCIARSSAGMVLILHIIVFYENRFQLCEPIPLKTESYIWATCSAISDDKVGIMTTLHFHCQFWERIDNTNIF